jgi:hypothetical protein
VGTRRPIMSKVDGQDIYNNNNNNNNNNNSSGIIYRYLRGALYTEINQQFRKNVLVEHVILLEGLNDRV